MDRRRFLQGLMAAAAAPELGRVYSFPSKIIIPNKYEMFMYVPLAYSAAVRVVDFTISSPGCVRTYPAVMREGGGLKILETWKGTWKDR